MGKIIGIDLGTTNSCVYVMPRSPVPMRWSRPAPGTKSCAMPRPPTASSSSCRKSSSDKAGCYPLATGGLTPPGSPERKPHGLPARGLCPGAHLPGGHRARLLGRRACRHGLGVLLLVILAKAAAARRLPPACPVLANRLEAPVSLVESTLEALAGAGLVAEAAPGAAGRIFVPLARPEDVPAAEIRRVLDGYGRASPPESWSARLPVAGELLAAIDHPLPHPTLADLLDRFGARLDDLDKQDI